MKTKIITTLKKELLIVEAKDEKIAWAIIFQKYGVKAVSDYTLLGKTDEIKEEDARELVGEGFNISTNKKVYNDYKDDCNCFKTALYSFHSALESEIYWENPEPKLSDFEYFLPSINEGVKLQKKFNEAQEKTFDRNRTLIFVKI